MRPEGRPEDDEKALQTREWLEKARHDLAAAERAMVDPPLFDVTTFHCQRAVEKALKAYLVWQDQPFHKTHNLEELVRQCAAVDAAFDGLLEAGNILSPYAIDPRYPGPFSDPTPDEAAEAIRLARGAFEVVLSHLPEALRT
jgi:HEPN domain-containing protein